MPTYSRQTPRLGVSTATALVGALLLLSACVTVPPPAPPEDTAAGGASPLPPPTAVLPAPPVEVRIAAVGDIMLDGTARPVLRDAGYDYPFAELRQFFADAHIVFGNLEGPLTDGGTPEQDKTYVFRSPPDKVARALAGAGFNVVSLANNHTLDYGPEGLRETRAALDAVGIRYAGAGDNLRQARAPVLFQVAGQRVALLAYSLTLPEHFFAGRNKAGTAFGHEAHVRADVAAARADADIVLVSFHWGQEGKVTLRDYQTRLGRAAIDAGAQAVIGHHPHILQGVERYKDGVILYSLGNFTFGSYSKTASSSVVARLTFVDGRLRTLHLHPINVNNFEVQFQPKVLSGATADRVVGELRQLSLSLHTELLNENGVGVVQFTSATAAR